MAATVVRSHCKINLGLRIGPPRPDGFHHLTTLFQTLALHDCVTVEAEPAPATEITLTSNEPRVPTDSRNTAYRIVAAALAQLGVDARVRIHLEKKLPPQGGMGAGSANAAAALLGLERQLGLSLAPVERLRIAERVGSDVPLFLIGGTVYAHNRGELVLPYPDLPSLPCLIVAPGVGSSTPAAFRAWDAQITQLTPEAAHSRLNESSRVYASAFTPAGQAIPGKQPGSGQTGASGVPGAGGDGNVSSMTAGDLAGSSLLALVRTGIENDFEEVVFQQHPSLRAIKHALQGDESVPPGESRTIELRTGEPRAGSALVAMLSGSGSSLFGLYRTEADAEAARQRIQSLRSGARCFLTGTVGREAYWSSMFDES